MRRATTLLSIGFLVALASSVIADRAGADSVDISFVGTDGNNLHINTPTLAEGAYLHYTTTGPYQYTFSNSTNPSALSNGTHYGFCIQFNQTISGGPQGTFMVETLAQDLSQNLGASLGPIAADQILYLINQYSTSTPSGHPTGLDPSMPTSNPQVYNDALSIAIWDVLQASGPNGTLLKISNSSWSSLGNTASSGGNINADFDSGSTAAITMANTWLSALKIGMDQTSGLFPSGQVVAFYNSGVQDQSLILGIAYPFTPVPEPHSMIGLAGLGLMGSLIGGVLLCTRKRRTLDLRGYDVGGRICEIG